MKIENVEVRDIAKEFGTPVYVYSLEILHRSIGEIKQLAPVTRYAMKANSNVRILKEMLDSGVKIDAVSIFEVQRALRAGFKTDDICFTSDVFFNDDDVTFCLENNIYCNCGTLGMVAEYDGLEGFDKLYNKTPSSWAHTAKTSSLTFKYSNKCLIEESVAFFDVFIFIFFFLFAS